ncbi:class I SAM-dependent methyltransferase [Sphaerisporangium sp. TRM90804]|uniref:class I SAM-dependent methyltransferase n=1 Tax=Sphaerisporangium sp. TRM90804 TaxID=3031113 RepID=UPI002447C6C1|nr:class I SAM-dependent methyltransferase [Sphaerisporangium sp. TRM90804]MDH2425986.1 class I SAM-dependent methyltransferase [Sphaerisporangium sp. TRM90804]
MTSTERWLTALWPFVHAHLPPSPGRVLEIGCGPAGGFVPALRSAGYDATGVDPDAPDEPGYRRTTFEDRPADTPFDAIVACTSLHHVADLDTVLDRMAEALAPGGTAVVVEWSHERFDERTAAWCFDRLGGTGEPGWLHRHRDRWRASGEPWDAYRASWAGEESLHRGEEIVHALRGRFLTRSSDEGPYFFSDLDGVTAADEQAAIDSGRIQATGIRYVGVRGVTPKGPGPG